MEKPNLLSLIGLAITRVRNFVINAIFLLLVVGIIVGIVQGAMSLQVEDGSALVIDPAGVIVEEARPDYSLTGLLSQPGGPGQTAANRWSQGFRATRAVAVVGGDGLGHRGENANRH